LDVVIWAWNCPFEISWAKFTCLDGLGIGAWKLQAILSPALSCVTPTEKISSLLARKRSERTPRTVWREATKNIFTPSCSCEHVRRPTVWRPHDGRRFGGPMMGNQSPTTPGGSGGPMTGNQSPTMAGGLAAPRQGIEAPRRPGVWRRPVVATPRRGIDAPRQLGV
jgi:hypothetical protein